MIEKRICEAFPGGHASYPQFSPEAGEEAAAQRMNDFYRAFREAALSYGAALCEDRREGLCQFTAEYCSRPAADGAVEIAFTLRLRRRGRTEAVKTLTHHWREGYLCPPARKKHHPPKIIARLCGRRKS